MQPTSEPCLGLTAGEWTHAESAVTQPPRCDFSVISRRDSVCSGLQTEKSRPGAKNRVSVVKSKT